MLEITGIDIAALNDEDLRSLVGKLCESELRSHGLSTSAVTWGGNQNAPDGGIDVRVMIKDGAPPGGFLPRTSVGFQVKKTDFTPGLIGPEMRPSDHLRPSISKLIDEHGAYIIASSGSDTSDSAWADRLNAMRSALADKTNHTHLHVDFYDRNRLATWTRSHPGLIVWVRHKVSRSIPGWQTYGSWAGSPDGIKDEYLLDDKASLHIGTTDEKGIDVTQGIDHIRNVLRVARGVVRLAGLSGVGKTRLVQALFDERVGNNPLDPDAVVYTDMNDNPSPQPTGMISDLIASRIRAIVVVDNCAPDLHRRITEVCRASNSLISAITVEYDVQDDEPEGTEVFRLVPSSTELVSKLIARRFPTLTQLDVNLIADFSGGNARVALALANTLERHESVAGLQDEELFRRLFHQRQVHDDSLLKAAQACALLYSFHGEALSGDDAELPKLAALVGTNAQQLFAKVAHLKQRDLIQRRSVWRAILPHAIANRLAKMALREIPLALIEAHFDTERLLRSFSRRLGYLHESHDAKHIAEQWLGKDGWLADVGRLNEFGLAMFNNIAPISPEMTLSAIERALSGPNGSDLIHEQTRDRIGIVLLSIAYDPSLFDRSVAAMIPLALREQMDRSHPIRSVLVGLFHIFLSGTHATIEQRTAIAYGLLCSVEAEKRTLGLELLEALLKADYFPAVRSFEFGARVRDYGYWPKTLDEKAHWFATTLLMARQFASKNGESVEAIRVMIAQSIWGVWFLGPEVQDQLEAIAEEIAENGYWQQGWIAVRTVLSSPPVEANIAAMGRLRALEIRLRPRSIVEQVRAVVLSQRWDNVEMDDNNDTEPNNAMAAYEKAYATAEELGKAVCRDQAVFAVLLPDLVRGGAARLFPFGRGLAIGSGDHLRIWDQLTQAVAATEEGKLNLDTVSGFLNGVSVVDEQLCEALLEVALTHETLGTWFPFLQSSVTISSAGADRLKRAATLGRARPSTFRFLGSRNSSSGTVSEDDLRSIVLSLAEQKNGFGVATEILSMRFQSEGKQKKDHPSELIDAGRTLLSSPDFGVRDNSYDYHLHTIANVCLYGADGSAAAQSLCKRIKKAFMDHTFRAYNFQQFLQSIFNLQPRIALDVFFGDASQADGSEFDVIEFEVLSNRQKQPLDGVPIAEMLRWCDEKPAEHYPAMSHAVSYHTAAAEGDRWTPLALEMLRRAPDPVTVLETFISRFGPRIWSGSRAAIVESRLGLLDQLGELKSRILDDCAARNRLQIMEFIARLRKSEDERDSRRDERFE